MLFHHKFIDKDTSAIPTTFTSDSSIPGYVCSASNTQNPYYPWSVWTQDYTTSDWGWYSGSVSMPQWIQIEVPQAFVPSAVAIYNEINTPANMKAAVFQASNDGTNWTSLYTISDWPNTATHTEKLKLNTSQAFKYFRLYITDAYQTGVAIQAMQIFKREIFSSGFNNCGKPVKYRSAQLADCAATISVPLVQYTTPHNLTSNTSDPRYIVSQIANLDSTALAFRAMDGSLSSSNGCSHTNSGDGRWWKIEFVDGPAIVTKMIITDRNNYDYRGMDATLQGSNDDQNWTNLKSFTTSGNWGAVNTFDIPNTTAYKWYRIRGNDSYYLIIGQVQFTYLQ